MPDIVEEQELSLAWVPLWLSKPVDALSLHETEVKTTTVMKSIIPCTKKRRNNKFGEAQGGEANSYYFICIFKWYF